MSSTKLAGAMLAGASTPRGIAKTPRNGLSPGIPFLPGYVCIAEQTLERNKQQSLSYGPGGAMDTLRSNSDTDGIVPKIDIAAALATLNDPFHRYTKGDEQPLSHDEREDMRASARNTYRPAIAPAWLKHDRQVLRFFAYFQEPVHESPKENFRVRLCTIYFYLEDGTMMISEPKVANSGMPQGTFVKRHRVPRPEAQGGGCYEAQDLDCGKTIAVYSRSFRILDCDDSTRTFYRDSLGKMLAPAEEAPMDSFRASSTARSAQGSARRGLVEARAIAESKEYIELALGGNRKNRNLQQYLENDRKVLRFNCYWDDPTRYGSRMYYAMHYYLADDTVELLESLPRNSGRDPWPVFWRRAPLKKGIHVAAAPGMPEPRLSLYKPEDFIVGSDVQVYGRKIVIYDCDDFTREFFRQYMGVEQDSLQLPDPPVVHVRLSHPPHSGFGTEEDSKASCLNLTPRPPRRDINKLMENSDKMLRFEGKMMNDKPEDANRRFVIGLHLADDSISVWEPKQRNSGHTEGKYASRARRRDQDTGKWLSPQDFSVGTTVAICGTPFLLTNADEGTLVYMETRPDEFPASNARLLASRIAGLKGSLLKATETLDVEQLRQMAVAELGVYLTPHELLTFARAFGDSGPSNESGLPTTIITAQLLGHM